MRTLEGINSPGYPKGAQDGAVTEWVGALVVSRKVGGSIPGSVVPDIRPARQPTEKHTNALLVSENLIS